MNTRACVLHTDGNTATVRAFKQSACSGCTNCTEKNKCHVEFMLAETPDSFDLKAKNDIGARVGDIVEICTDSRMSLFLAFLTFVFPVIAAIAAYIIADTATSGFIPIAASGIVFFIFFFVCAFAANRMSGKLSQTSICKIIKESGEK